MFDSYVLEVTPEYRLGRGRYWRPGSNGYTNDPCGAGIYPAASFRVKHAFAQATMDDDEAGERRYLARPVADVLRELEAAAVEAQRRVVQFRELVAIAELEGT